VKKIFAKRPSHACVKSCVSFVEAKTACGR